MSDTNPFSNNQWLQYYQETTASDPPIMSVPDSGQFLDDHASSVMPGFAADNMSSLDNTSPTANCSTGGNSSTSPQGGTPKPIRRRSRASKKTPVTLLNTSATNFRALVQQFTGCPSTMAASTPFGRQKGPVNLNFERNDQLTETSRYLYSNQQEISTPNLQNQTQATFSLGSRISHEATGANAQISGLDDFVMENVALRNEFIDESTVNGSNTNGGYFF